MKNTFRLLRSHHLISKVGIMLMLFCFSFLQAQEAAKPYVVLVSLDGFRWDYPKYFPTPNLDALAKSGVHAKSMKPSYPTKTFPNHYSMVTGLYPDHHGIINNIFYDPTIKKVFNLSSAAKNDPQFYGGNPIWNLAEEQGVKSASFYWPGSDTGSKSPSIYKKYDDSVSYSTRIDSVLSWLQLPEKVRPHLITLYFDEPDRTGHGFGPLSDENKKMVSKMDRLIGVLSRQLDALSIAKEINLIVVSDHGMAAISNSKKVAILDYLKPQWLGYQQVVNPIMSLEAKPGFKDSITQALKKVPHIKFWPSNTLPARLHFGTNTRVLDFIIEAEQGYSLVATVDQKISGGTHGYDNNNKDMQAIFYATGPNFKVNKSFRTFENVSIYPLIAKILGLQIAKVDGNLDQVQGMLREE